MGQIHSVRKCCKDKIRPRRFYPKELNCQRWEAWRFVLACPGERCKGKVRHVWKVNRGKGLVQRGFSVFARLISETLSGFLRCRCNRIRNRPEDVLSLSGGAGHLRRWRVLCLPPLPLPPLLRGGGQGNENARRVTPGGAHPSRACHHSLARG
jgi:hypothetical protein